MPKTNFEFFFCATISRMYSRADPMLAKAYEFLAAASGQNEERDNHHIDEALILLAFFQTTQTDNTTTRIRIVYIYHPYGYFNKTQRRREVLSGEVLGFTE